MKLFKLFSKRGQNVSDKEDMANLVNSIFNSKPLYDELKTKCHPDLYLDEEQKTLANDLFQELQKKKNDIRAMQELKTQIDTLYSSIKR